MAVGPASLPVGLQQAVRSASVVVIVSPLTDARPVTGWLRRHGVDFREVELGMASPLSRDEFHRLQSATGWRGLPQIFIDGSFVGGIQEFFAHPRVSRAAFTETGDGVRRAARRLGYLGAVPFAACAGAALVAEGTAQALAVQSLLGYGALILSFVGALHWARGLQSGMPGAGPGLLVLSVMPALLAWVALLLPPAEGLALLAAGFVGLYLFDRRAWGAQPWFVRLRLHLSTAAVLCLASGAMVAALTP
ncbi:MAG: DUF3429 family protein [Gammaproteobacteria bacterium]|jgi:glutaredoxin